MARILHSWLAAAVVHLHVHDDHENISAVLDVLMR